MLFALYLCQNWKLTSSYFAHLKKPTDNKILIAILASCGALLIMIVILGVCVSYRRKPYHENQVGIKRHSGFF